MSSTWDCVIVGAGLNGLVCAAYLAKSGKRVLVLEKHSTVGGTMSTVEFARGHQAPATIATVDQVHPDIIAELKLQEFGLETIQGSDNILLSPDGDHLRVNLEDSEALSDEDRRALEDLRSFLERLSVALMPVLTKPLADPSEKKISGAIDLLKVGWALRRLGDEEMPEALRFLPMTVRDVLDERFESEKLKALIASRAIQGSWLSPRSAGSAYGLLHYNQHWAGGLMASPRYAKRGPGALSEAVASAVRSLGGDIRTGESVTEILVEEGRTKGVRTSSGETIESQCVVSAVDLRSTFVDLTGTEWLNPNFLEQVNQIRSHGSVMLLHLALDDLPAFPGLEPEDLSGVLIVGDSLDYLERAFDAAKYGEIPKEPMLSITLPSVLDLSTAPAGKHTMHVWAQFMPNTPATGDWESAKTHAIEGILGTISRYAPGIKEQILDQKCWSPRDLSNQFGLTNGCIHHADLVLDQLLYMRPIPRWFNYESPIKGLFLCGPSVHPGGGGTGLSGKCAAEEIADRI